MKRTNSSLFLHTSGIFLFSLLCFFVGKNGGLKPTPKEKGDLTAGNVSATRSSRERANEDERWQTDAGRMDLLRSRLKGCSTREDFEAELADLLLHSDKSEVGRHLALLFDAWLQVNPQDALRGSAEMEKIRHDYSRVANVFFNWSQTNPEAAAELLAYSLDGKQLAAGEDPPFLDGIDLPALLLSAVMGLGTQDPGKAGTILSEMKASPFQESAFSVLIQNWLPAEPEFVLDWAKSLESDDTRQMVLGLVAENLASQVDSTQVIAQLSAIEDQVDRDVALQSFARQWTEHQPEGAYDWVQSLPDEETRLLLMPEVMAQHMVTEEAEVTAWLNTQEPSEALDPTIIAYSVALANLKPGEALARVSSVSDPEQRDVTYYILADRWSRRDAAGLQSFLANVVDLPPILNSFLEETTRD